MDEILALFRGISDCLSALLTLILDNFLAKVLLITTTDKTSDPRAGDNKT